MTAAEDAKAMEPSRDIKETGTRDDYKQDTNAAAAASGPWFRRRSIRRRVLRGSRKKRCFFNWISFVTCLVTMEAAAMIILAFRSNTILTIIPSLEQDAIELLVWLDTALGGGGAQDREELAELEAYLVQMTEDRLDHGFALEHEQESTAIDNYYNRSHHFEKSDQPTVLLVGGMKGSGDRAVVDALVQLQIPMIMLERARTQKDSDRKAFHTGQIAWRAMVNLVISSGINSPYYEFSDLPKLTQLRMRQEWEKFYQGFVAKHLPEPTSTVHRRRNILFAFQAHDSLLMVPVFQQFMMGPLKVIQVVRDGRDVSMFSSKMELGHDKKEHPMQSMAERFVLETFYDASNISKSYDDTGSLSFELQRIVESMEMWSDWNTHSQMWLEKHARNDKTHQLDYLQLRIEDLLSPEKKLEALLQLSNFTGVSNKIPFEMLCCLSRQAMVVEKPNNEYLKGFAKARAQHDLLQKYSAELSFRHTEEEEDTRRKARLGDLITSNNRFGIRRQPGPLFSARAGDKDAKVHKEVHQQRQSRFQAIGERLAERFPGSPGEVHRRLLDLMDEARVEDAIGNIQSEEVSNMFAAYHDWRKSLGKARTDETAAAAAIETGEKLLEEYRIHSEHLKGVLTEDSFLRSIKWLKNRHNQSKEQPRDGELTEAMKPPDLTQHYGKWVLSLKDNPLLAERLHSVGNLTLQAFGYEPRARFMDFDPENRKSQCDMHVTCG
jgi:Sulfotransferase domain